jgi:anti-sigma B factor antagonist
MIYDVVATDDGISRLVIEGELDIVSVFDLKPVIDNIVNSRPRRVEVELARLRMVDSSGVGALIGLYKRVRAQGGEVVLKGLQNQPLAIFRLLQLDRIVSGEQAPAATGSTGKT